MLVTKLVIIQKIIETCTYFAIGTSFNSKYKSYFGSDCIKENVKDLLKIETKHRDKLNKTMRFTEKGKLNRDANDICHICRETCVNKVRESLP